VKATDLLSQQHRSVKALFKKLASGRGEPTELLEQLADQLAAHMLIEHELFYPAVAEVDEFLIEEAFEEHALGEIAIKRLLSAQPDDESFKAKVTAAKELIEHHADEEEEELFPKVEKQLDSDRLKALGKEMKARFEEALALGHAQLLPRGMARTTADAAEHKFQRVRARSRAKAA
jgi:hemerythrin superfamily protein